MTTSTILQETSPAKNTQSKSISSPYELQKRVMTFAISARTFVEKLPKNLALTEDARGLVRASGNLGMHCIDADEAPSKKAFTTSMRLARKDIKEILYWLALLDRGLAGYAERRRTELMKDAHDLRRIFSAICKTALKNNA